MKSNIAFLSLSLLVVSGCGEPEPADTVPEDCERPDWDGAVCEDLGERVCDACNMGWACTWALPYGSDEFILKQEDVACR